MMNFKKMTTMGLTILAFFATVLMVGSKRDGFLERQEVNAAERSHTFLLANLSGTLPSSTSYIDINATTNPCGFIFTGNAQRGGTNPNYLLGITSGRTPAAEIIITIPSYVSTLTAIELTAYTASTSLRYLAINGIKDDTAVTNSYSYANPVNIGRIPVSGNSVTITSPNGNILIKEFIVYYQ